MTKLSGKTKTAHRARLALAFQLTRQDEQYFKVISVRSQRVVFRFAGEIVTFDWKEGQWAASTSIFLSNDDYATLFRLAEQLRSALYQGYADAKAERPPKKAKTPKTSAQMALFTPAELPIAR